MLWEVSAYSLLFPFLSYLHEVARRHPYFYAPELLYYAEKQNAIMTECCAEADKAACLGPKVIPGQTQAGTTVYSQPQLSAILGPDLGHLNLWMKLLSVIRKPSSLLGYQ